MPKKSFYLHYNRPQSLREGKPKMSVHYNKPCYIVDGIDCAVPTFSKINKRQPRFVMKGYADSVEIIGGIAIIK